MKGCVYVDRERWGKEGCVYTVKGDGDLGDCVRCDGEREI